MNPYNLLVVAHPDDETIFFSELLLNHREKPWLVISITGYSDLKRRAMFHKACNMLGIGGVSVWDFIDVDGPLPIAVIAAKLRQLPSPDEVFTHGLDGDYGHQHHKDVAHATRAAFPGAYVLDYTNPDIIFDITPAQHLVRCGILSRVYEISFDAFLDLRQCLNSSSFSLK